jgi:hypothetical protein
LLRATFASVCLTVDVPAVNALCGLINVCSGAAPESASVFTDTLMPADGSKRLI